MGRARLAAIAAAAGLASCVVLASAPPRDGTTPAVALPRDPAGDPAVPATWTIPHDTAPRLSLAAPDLAPAAPVARRIAGGWQEAAQAGDFAHGPVLHVVLTRTDDPAPRAGHFVEIARRAAETGLALVRLARPVALESRFDGVESAEATLATPDGTATRRCLSFRMQANSLGFGLAGWLCEDAPDVARRLACRLDRLALTAEIVGDLALQAGFAGRRRDADCVGAAPDAPIQAAVPAPDPWPGPAAAAAHRPARATARCRGVPGRACVRAVPSAGLHAAVGLT